MKKVKRTPRNYFRFALLSYTIVAVVMGTGMVLSPNTVETASGLLKFLYAFIAPFDLLREVFLQPTKGRLWMGLGAIALLFTSVLWVLSRNLMESPEDEQEAQRKKRLEELRPK